MLTFLYSLYGIFMKRETLHTVNRIVLLTVLLASMVLPICQIKTGKPNVVTEGREMIEHQISNLQNPLNEDAERVTVLNTYNGVKHTHLPIREDINAYMLIAIVIYLAGLVVCWLRYLWQLAALIMLILRSKRIEMEGVPNYVRVITNPDVKTPCSWMRWVILNPDDVNTRAIIDHELAHIHYGHSWDMLICELTCRMLWCVPFVWMLRQDLRDVHEFQADRRVLSLGIKDEEYQLLLIRKATGTRLQPVVNALNQSPIKRRFEMMYKKPSRRWVALKATYLLPLSAFTLMAFARPQTMDEIEKEIETTETEVTQAIKASGVMEQVVSTLGIESETKNEDVVVRNEPADSLLQYEATLAYADYPRTTPPMADDNLIKADLADSEYAEESFMAIDYKRATELLDSTMQAVGARKIDDGTWIGHFQPSLNNDTVRISKVEYLDKLSRLMIKVRFSHNEKDPYAYNMLLQQETRKERTGYYIRNLYPAKATERHYDEPKNDPKLLSTDDVLVKGFNLFDFHPVAIEQNKRETRLYYFLPVSTDDDKFVESMIDSDFTDYVIHDVATGDNYMFRSLDKSYFKFVKTEKHYDKEWSIYQVCMIFPPLDKRVKEFQLRPFCTERDYFPIHRIKDIPRKARVITN